MLLGVRPEEQKRLVELGYKVRVYVPYGDEWYGYLMRRMAEKPSNLALFVRSLASKN
jgi:proline dehydrogenase